MIRIDQRTPLIRVTGTIIGGAVILLIALIQPFLYPELPIAVLYIVPVIIITWVGGLWPGVAASFGAAAARMLADDAIGISHPSVPYWNFGLSVVLYLLVAYLLERVHRMLLHERELALTDPLTRLGNRRFFEEVATIELNRSRRYSRSFALAYVDVDRFKQINDRRGHAEGDRLLQLIARELIKALRTSDIVARLGGDEFAVILPETPAEGAAIAMQKAHERLTAAVAEAQYDVSFSMGVITWSSGDATLAALLDRADRIMYRVKEGGRGHVETESFEEERVTA